MNIVKQLQKNKKFRSILKKHKIGWISVARYCVLGEPSFVDDKITKKALYIGNYNNFFRYFVCYVIEKEINENESELINVF